MRISRQLPKQGDFWERYAGLVPTLNKLSYLTQLISFASEYTVFYLLIKPKVNELAPDYAHTIALIGAAIVSLTVEIGIRKFLPYSVKTILYKRWSGLDLPLSIFIWLFAIGLFGVSVFTSFKGSKDAVYEATTTGASRDKIDERLTDDQRAILKRFTADSLQTAQTYDGQIIALQEAVTATVQAKREQLRSIERRETATDQSFLSQKSKLREAMATVTAETAVKVVDLQTKKADALEQLIAKRETKEGEAKTTATTGVQKLENKGTQYGGYVAYFTIICHIFLAIAICMNEIVLKGSQIQEKPILSTFHFDPSVVGEWWGVLSNKYQVWARTKIRAWNEKTPDAPKPGALPVLYQHEAEQPRIVIGGFMPMQQPNANTGNPSVITQQPNASSGNPSVNNATVITQPSEPPKMATKNCALPACGCEFTAKVNWQKYCCEEHRQQHHAEKHGRPFNPSQYHNHKP